MEITLGRKSFEISDQKLFALAITIIAMGIFYYIAEGIFNTVTYEGWNTKLTPVVYQSWSTKEYVSITLFKADKKSSKGYVEKTISLEDNNNLEFFWNFLNNAQYDHYWVQ
jgi:hypothetical protein